MGRLETHRQKQFTSKIITLVIVFVIILYFIFSVGIKLLLNTSVFVANLFSKKTDNQLTKKDDVYGSVGIDSIPTATNSAKIIVAGSVVNYNQLTFYLNGENVKEITLSSSDTFSEEIGDLKKGNNEVFVKAKISDNNIEKQTQIYNIFYKDEKPKLEIKEPTDKSKTSNQEILIKGLTDKETYIRINDLPIVVDSQGNFQTSIKLKDGENTVVITAQDIAGNIETKTISVTYQKED